MAIFILLRLFYLLRSKKSASNNEKLNYAFFHLDVWNDRIVKIYHRTILGYYKERMKNEDAINIKSTSLLAANGVIIMLMATFLGSIIKEPYVLTLFGISLLYLILSVFLTVLVIRPVKRYMFDVLSHQKGYCTPMRNGDENDLRKKMLEDALKSAYDLDKVLFKKTNMFEYALYLFLIAMVIVAAMFCVHILTSLSA